MIDQETSPSTGCDECYEMGTASDLVQEGKVDHGGLSTHQRCLLPVLSRRVGGAHAHRSPREAAPP